MRETREKMAKEQERKLQELLEAQKTGMHSEFRCGALGHTALFVLNVFVLGVRCKNCCVNQ
mgnify:CR=1 FL=1